MTVLAYDPYLADAGPGTRPEQTAPSSSAWRSCASRSHVVTLHLPLTPQTHHLVDAGFLAALPAGADPGELRPRRAARPRRRGRALADGRLAGLGLDVFDPEPPTTTRSSTAPTSSCRRT